MEKKEKKKKNRRSYLGRINPPKQRDEPRKEGDVVSREQEIPPKEE